MRPSPARSASATATLRAGARVFLLVPGVPYAKVLLETGKTVYTVSAGLRPLTDFSQEAGTTNKRIAHVREPNRADAGDADANPPAVGDGVNQPRMSLKEEYVLNVEQVASEAGLQPLTRMLPPWYVPQAVGHLLPRLLDLRHPKNYLVATYVSDAREVMMRYIDVLPEERVNLNGQAVQALRINDRLGLEGSITTHYYNPDGHYLGTENKDSKTLVLPTDKESLQKIWQNANLDRPGAVEKQGAGAEPSPTASEGK